MFDILINHFLFEFEKVLFEHIVTNLTPYVCSHWMVVTEEGRMVIGVHEPRLVLVSLTCEGGQVCLSGPGMEELRLPLLQPHNPVLNCRWVSSDSHVHMNAAEKGDSRGCTTKLAEHIQAFLGKPGLLNTKLAIRVKRFQEAHLKYICQARFSALSPSYASASTQRKGACGPFTSLRTPLASYARA